MKIDNVKYINSRGVNSHGEMLGSESLFGFILSFNDIFSLMLYYTNSVPVHAIYMCLEYMEHMRAAIAISPSHKVLIWVYYSVYI